MKQIIRPGEVNWMTAGSGIAHSERFEDPAVLANSTLEMIQTWVALPVKDEESAPTLCYLHAVMQAGARFGLPPGHSERGFYIVEGSVEVASQPYEAGRMLVFNKGTDPVIVATKPITLMMPGGEPLGEGLFGGILLSSSKERIEQAKVD